MVIVEAMAMSRPVLSTPVGIAPEIVHPPRTGLLTSDVSAPALAAGLREMLALRAGWKEMGVAARREAAEFTAVRMARRHTELYEMWRNET
jgi:glycosyltransferase involved in cell wall biosynthesis